MKHILAVIALFVALMAVDTACKPHVPPVLHPIVDCINAQRGPIIEQLITSWWPADGGAIDIERIKSDAISKGLEIGGCAFVQFVQKYLTPAPGTAAPPPELATALKDAFEKYREQHANNSTFKTKDGDL